MGYSCGIGHGTVTQVKVNVSFCALLYINGFHRGTVPLVGSHRGTVPRFGYYRGNVPLFGHHRGNVPRFGYIYEYCTYFGI